MAFITAETRKDIIDLVVGMLGTAPSADLLAELTNAATSGASFNDLAEQISKTDAYVKAHPIGQTAAEYSADVLDTAITNGVITDELRQDVIDIMTSSLNSGEYTRSSIAAAVVSYLSNPANLTQDGLSDIVQAFQNRAAAAEHYTVQVTLEGGEPTTADLASSIADVTSEPDTLTKANAIVDASVGNETAEQAQAALEAAKIAYEAAAAKADATDAIALGLAAKTALTNDKAAKAAVTAATEAFAAAVAGEDAATVVEAQGALIIAEAKAEKAAAALIKADAAEEAAKEDDANAVEALKAYNLAKEVAGPISVDVLKSTFNLSITEDNLEGNAGDNLFRAKVVQNSNGEQTNQLGTGDEIDGLGGNDILTATVQAASALNDGPAAGIAPITVDVEEAHFTVLDADETNLQGLINAKDMLGLNRVASIQSDTDLTIHNLTTLTDTGDYAARRNTDAITVRMDHTGNGAQVDAAANMTVLFDNDYLLADSSSSDKAYYFILDREASVDSPTTPLARINASGLSFNIDGVEKVIEIDSEAFTAFVGGIDGETALTGTQGTHAGYVALLQAALATAQESDASLADISISLDTSITRTEGLDGTTFALAIPAIVVSTTGVEQVTPGRFLTTNDVLGDFDVYGATGDAAATTAEDPIAVQVELDKVGRGADGGSLTIGAMSSDGNNNWGPETSALEQGIEVFNVTVEGDNTQNSSLSALQSTNNTLTTVNVSWDAASVADLEIGNSESGSAIPNGARLSTVIDGRIDVTTARNSALKDVQTFTAANNNTETLTSGVVNTADVTVHAHLSDEVVAKYLNRTDTAANADADNVAFTYTTGKGADTINLNISSDNLAASGTGSRDDFSLAINTGDGNDTVVTQIGNGVGTATTAWVINNEDQANLSIDSGAGDDTIHTNGAGTFTILSGAGNDAIYSDNSGMQLYDNGTDAGGAAGLDSETRATWVVNSADQSTADATAQSLADLVSAEGVTSRLTTTTANVANLNLTVSYYGIEQTVQVADTHAATGDVVTDLDINNAIKAAISGNVYLNNLLTAEDGTGNTLVITSKTDGVMEEDALSFSLSSDTVTGGSATTFAQISDAQANALGFANAVAGVHAAATGRFTPAFADDGVDTDFAGGNSIAANYNTITSGTGTDTVVLSTSSDTAEIVDVSDGDADVVFNATGATITVDIEDTVITASGVSISGGVGTVTVAGLAVTGSAEADTIVGNAGADVITGGAGLDTINGGAGTDRFVFNAGDSNSTLTDVITGYATTEQIDHATLTVSQNSTVVVAAAGTAGLAGAGAAATFNAADTTLAQHIVAIEAALADTTHTAGEAAHWQEGADVYVFITDGVAGVGADDVIVKLVGVDSTDAAFDVLTIAGGNLTLA